MPATINNLSQAWPDFSHLWNSQGTLAYTTRTLCNYSCRPIRLQNGYEECSDYVCVNDVTTIERKMATQVKQLNPESAIRKAALKLGYDFVKAEQLKVVVSVLRGQDVFAVLPTGYGKSFCFSVLPFVHDQLFPDSEASIVLVITPLTAIMKDQVMCKCNIMY